MLCYTEGMTNTNPHEELAQWKKALNLAEVICGLSDPIATLTVLKASPGPWREVANVAKVALPSAAVKDMTVEIVERTVGASPLGVVTEFPEMVA